MSRKAVSGAPRSVTIRVTEEIRDELKRIGKGDACAAIQALLDRPVAVPPREQKPITTFAEAVEFAAPVRKSMYIGKKR